MKKLCLIGLSLLLSACAATVPKEVVELSYKMNQDMTHVEHAYTDLVRQHIAVLKKQREDYLYNEWVPDLLEDWIEEGMLIEMAQGKVVYDNQVEDFVSVDKPDRIAQLNSIKDWALVATDEIEAKRRELLAPLEQAEITMIANIQQSFGLMKQGNQTITAHLNSIREVQDVQNQLLESVDLEQLRNNINQKLSELSDQAEQGLDKVRELDSKAQPYLEKTQ
ncbi:hypothetical protein [Vibrio crassostreae]|uniref:hypothetical protein n=1 Tax=Vibrio crassostreae TaxID=246167 RepID=UPI000F462580|nr:hypothetical protein [Vibrio crassostreae]ROO57895.1 hypothetical protein EDB56_1011043 [Vibrio crassostreae]ROO76834.1 hypothetical protein EDB53_0662 [Vibrio crassostreae]ROR75595.1 hypothetical protein EDB54_1107 [Vibrio crassostreae]TCN99362.1 hypothetical protein EDB50_1011148 [Vibrio crassostreae]TCV33045.1 hypothetical protein EDB70_1011032 [Vibrio crassostreae]